MGYKVPPLPVKIATEVLICLFCGSEHDAPSCPNCGAVLRKGIIRKPHPDKNRLPFSTDSRRVGPI